MSLAVEAVVSNVAEYSVSELSGALKRTVEEAFEHVRVRGEISGYRGPHSSGHAYFALKDDRARLEAVIWRTSFGKLAFKPQEGLEVVATGKLTTYPGSSKYQIVIDHIEPAGAGALMALLNERRLKFEAEGLFDRARKKPLPFLPRVVGVVTSPTGAVIRDIRHRIADRFPLHLLVWPVRVQGETCGSEVAAAIEGFNALPEGGPIPRPDLLIVARGGGSLEDLWGFNDEAVVRAAAASAIPLISAVGHETDWTLIDHAADRRAPTPTGAAEMAVPVRADLELSIASLNARLSAAASRHLQDGRRAVAGLARALPSVDMLLALPRRRLDEAGASLGRCLRVAVSEKRRTFGETAALLAPNQLDALLREKRGSLREADGRGGHALDSLVGRRRQRFERLSANLRPHMIEARRLALRHRLEVLGSRLDGTLDGALRRRRTDLSGAWRVAESLNPARVLSRGYAMVLDEDGRPLVRAADVEAGARLQLQFADGTRHATADAGGDVPLAPRRTAAPRPKRATAKTALAADQGTLF